MEAKAQAKFVRIAPRKARIVMDLIRGKSVEEALSILHFIPKRASVIIEKVLRSAIANAEHNYEMKKDGLFVFKAYVDEGPTLKRFMPRAFGRAARIRKRTSHLTVVLREREGALKVGSKN
jgi:large subunit ribosomal protein L22